MKKIWLFLLGGGVLLVSNAVFSASISETQLREFSTKLETNKSKLLTSIDTSKTKLKTIANEASKFSDTTLFKAASCLGAIPPEDQNLNFEKITTTLKDGILNEYIKLDGDIKRLGFGLAENDPILFGNTIENFYNQNAIKINALESDYYLKTTKVKKDFLEYVENNKALLTQLAQQMDAITNIQHASSGATQALNDFTTAINTRSEFLKAIEKMKSEIEKSFEASVEDIFTQAVTKNQPSNDTQAKYLIHKDNFLKKFKTELNQAQYQLFSVFFSYPEYAELLEKRASVEKQFLTSSGTINCNLLLTTTFNLGKYAEGTEQTSEKIKKGLGILTDAVKNGKVNLKMLEAPTMAKFKETTDHLTRKLTSNFRLMLDAEQAPALIPSVENPVVSTPAPAQNIIFKQAFTKGQYHEQIKTLQTLLKTWGYYQGEITGNYSPATIEAVYHFQLKEGIITGKEANKSGYGRLGVRTRAKLNSML